MKKSVILLSISFILLSGSSLSASFQAKPWGTGAASLFGKGWDNRNDAGQKRHPDKDSIKVKESRIGILVISIVAGILFFNIFNHSIS